MHEVVGVAHLDIKPENLLLATNPSAAAAAAAAAAAKGSLRGATAEGQQEGPDCGFLSATASQASLASFGSATQPSLEEHPEQLMLKLGDFGMSRRTWSAGRAERAAGRKFVHSTLAFTAPENASVAGNEEKEDKEESKDGEDTDGDKPSDVRGRSAFDDYGSAGEAIDVWSLGICLFMMLYGQHPFLPANDTTHVQELAEKKAAEDLLQAPVAMLDKRTLADSVHDTDGGNTGMIHHMKEDLSGLEMLLMISQCELKFPQANISPTAVDLLSWMLAPRDPHIMDNGHLSTGRATMRDVLEHPWMKGESVMPSK
jgi:serine/threonine protein kinase